MRGIILLLLTGLVAFGADDPWSKVKTLKTGAELRIYKKGSTQPVLALMDELTDDNLVVVVKKTQTAIPRDQIDRIEARPAAGSRITKETTTKDTSKGPQGDPEVPGTSTSTSISVGSKPDFETVYRRPIGAPKK